MPPESKLLVLETCPVQGLIDVISKKWALLLVAVLGSYEKRRYGELMQELRGISTKTLADTLDALERAGTVKRQAFNEIPPRVEYSLTADGLTLRNAIVPLLRWAADRSKEKDCVILEAALKRRKA